MASLPPLTETLLSGQYSVSVRNTLYSEEYPYRAADVNYNHPDAPNQPAALQQALAAYKRLSKANPDKIVRLLHWPLIELSR